jgi:hypothetical protein
MEVRHSITSLLKNNCMKLNHFLVTTNVLLFFVVCLSAYTKITLPLLFDFGIDDLTLFFIAIATLCSILFVDIRSLTAVHVVTMMGIIFFALSPFPLMGKIVAMFVNTIVLGLARFIAVSQKDVQLPILDDNTSNTGINRVHIEKRGTAWSEPATKA